MHICVLVLIMLVSTFTAVSPQSLTSYRCDSNKQSIVATCLVRNVSLVSAEEIANASFPNDMEHLALTMVDGFVPEFTRALALKFPKVQDLTVDAMGIRKLYVWTKAEHLSARNNSIREVEFATEYHRLRSLRLDDNQLSKVPSFGRWFNELKLLSLDGNRLEQISLDSFAELEHLQSLSLARNGLITVEATARVPNRPPVQNVQLLKLKHLSLRSNHLLTVNISRWEMPSLVSLDVSNNDLYMLLDEPHQLRQFGALLNISYAGNDWNCGWLSDAQLVLRGQGITTPSQDLAERCERERMKVLQGICCYDHGFDQELARDPFESRWEQLNELRRRYELVQFAYDQVQDNDLNLITERAHQLRSKQIGPLEQDQDVIKSKLVRLRHALADENTHLERLQDRIERTVLDLEQTIDELDERANRPKPTLDTVHQQTISADIERIRERIVSLRHRIQDYLYKTSARERRIHRYNEQIEDLVDQLRKVGEMQQTYAERANALASRIYEVSQILEESLTPASDEEFNRIRAHRNGDYRISYRGESDEVFNRIRAHRNGDYRTSYRG
uniref:Leucine-rich immune protein (Short) n=1 Tax=Anopheles culicifacies TaxID=139723 RepID=A0A182MV20_9DIPT